MNFRDASGAWRAIDNRLVRRLDGALETRANSVDVEIPDTAEGEVSFGDGDRSVAFSLVGSDASTADVSGSVAEYADVKPDTDLSYEVDGRVLKETLTLASPDAPTEYRFDVDADGLRARLGSSGDVEFVDGAGRQRLGFQAPWMRDAQGAISRGASYEIEHVDGRDRVALRLDSEWLNSPERRFPVVVDPTVYTGWEHVCEIRGGARSNTSTCDGALSENWVGRDASGILYRSLFHLHPLADVVPETAQIPDSWFTVYLNGQSPVESSDLDLHHLTRGFAPGATWNRSDGRAPWSRSGGDYDPQRLHRASTEDADPSDGLLAFDITELARSLVSGEESSPNLLVKAADETRTHIDSFVGAGVKIRWHPRTGISPQYTYESFELSDGSTLSQNMASGNLVLSANDLGWEADDGRAPTVRYFNSLGLLHGDFPGTFGDGTQGSFGTIRLEHQWVDGSYIFAGPSGLTGVFQRRADGTFTPPADIDATLTELPDDTFTLEFGDSGEVWTFDSDGDLRQTRQLDGFTIDITWGLSGLERLADSAGHTATLGYDRYDNLRTLTDQDNAVHRYDYDGSDRLIAYTSPTGGQTRYTYDGSDRLTRISLPDRTALKIRYDGSDEYPSSITPVDAAGIDQTATSYDGGDGWTSSTRPAPPRTVYHYDPNTLIVDLVQTGSDAAISTAGAIPSLDGGYTRGDSTLTVDVSAAQAPDGIQLVELEVDGIEVDSVGPAPCDQWTCPTRAAETLFYDPTSDPEGTYEYRVNTIDGDNERTNGPLWRVTIDRTAPGTPNAFDASFDPDSSVTEIYWDTTDPALPDSTPGSGVGYSDYRVRRSGGAWSDWQSDDGRGIQLADCFVGEAIVVEVRAVDRAGNVGATGSFSWTVAEAPRRKVSLVISSSAAPEVEQWTPVLEPGETLAVVDGGARVVTRDAGGNELRTIATAWAVDASGDDVAMEYALDGATIDISIDHRRAGTRYPVMADTLSEDWTRAELNRARRLLWTTERPSVLRSTLDAGVALSIMPEGYEDMNEAERAFCFRRILFPPHMPNAKLCWEFEKDRRIATDMQNAWFTDIPQDSRGNAFRHTVWIALMTITAGNRSRHEDGLEMGRLHEENQPRRTLTPEQVRTFYRSRRMDIHNNRAGFAFTVAWRDSEGSWPSNTWVCQQALRASRSAWYWTDATGFPAMPSQLTFFRRGSVYAANRSQCQEWP